MVTAHFRRILFSFVILTFLISIPYLVSSDYFLYLIILSGIYFIAVSGLNLISGYVGKLSLGHAAFFGIGAYAAAILSLRWQAPFWLGVLAAGLIPSMVTLPIGYVSLKLRGPYFVIVTLAFAEIARMVIKNWVSLTGGPMGLPGIPGAQLSLLGRTIHFTDSTYYYLVLALGLLTFYIVRKLAASRIGRAWVAIREDEDRALSIGINSRLYALQALCWGSFFAGIAGGIYAYYMGLIAPEIVAFSYMITMLVMLILGGAGTAEGPIIGAIIFTVLPEILRIAEHYRLPILGGILMLSVIFFPAGLRPFLARLPEIFKYRRNF